RTGSRDGQRLGGVDPTGLWGHPKALEVICFRYWFSADVAPRHRRPDLDHSECPPTINPFRTQFSAVHNPLSVSGLSDQCRVRSPSFGLAQTSTLGKKPAWAFQRDGGKALIAWLGREKGVLRLRGCSAN
ncbi:MAG: hypothetical protein U1E06_00530, partial [Tabrizicola sp.]|nr:hypothetical protein [Tabrizicola sp.]